MMFVLALPVFFAQVAALLQQRTVEEAYSSTTRKYDIEETEAGVHPMCVNENIISFNSVIDSTFSVDAGEDFLMEFGNVFPEKAEQGGNTIDLQVVNILGTGKAYEAANVSANGIRGGHFGNVNIVSGVMATLNFKFIDRVTGQPVVPAEKFFFSVFDIDEKCDETSEEKIAVPQALNFFRTATTHVIMDGVFPDRATFFAQKCGNETTNPAYHNFNTSWVPEFTEDQLTKMVTFAMPNISHFLVRIWIADGLNGRNVMFAGSSPIVCPAQNTTVENAAALAAASTSDD